MLRRLCALHAGPSASFLPMSALPLKADIPETTSRAVKEYLATLDDAAFGAASDVTPKLVSPSDPAAQWTGAMRGPVVLRLCRQLPDRREVRRHHGCRSPRAIRQAEVGAAKTMIE